MKQKRKGARPITVQSREFSWYRGKTVTEIRNLETNKAVHVKNGELEEIYETVCGCCHEPDGGEIGLIMPKVVGHYITANLL